MHARGVPGHARSDTGATSSGPRLADRGAGHLCDVPWSRENRPGDAAPGVLASPTADSATADSVLHLRHRAHPRELRRIRRRVDEWAGRHAVPESLLADLQLTLGEAVSNGVEHAYRGTEPGTIEVHLAFRRAGGQVVIEVRVADHGTWRPVPEDTGYRGRGLDMIGCLARHVVVSRTERGTEVRFEVTPGR